MSVSPIRSPFPGMDPYLEARWSDVHVKLIGFIGESLQSLLPRALRARAEERVLLEEEDESRRPRSYRSDVAIVQSGFFPGETLMAIAGGTAAMIEPIRVRHQQAPAVERWVQIVDVTSGNRVVTAIEVLSPWNKRPGRLNRDYRRKVKDYARGRVSVVEIDLLRSPRGRLPVSEADIPIDRHAPYMACVRLGWDPYEWWAFPIPLRFSLPGISIPLRQADKPVVLELQPLIDRVYVAGGHDDIDYTRPLNPPLSSDDAAWTTALLSDRKTAGY
jgi:hypothetical protein